MRTIIQDLMTKTVFITGCSSGIGKATAIEFARNGWRVAATVRQPGQEQSFVSIPNVKLYALDVTAADQVEAVFKQVTNDFGTIDVVVNNAGYGVDGAFEAMDDETIRKQFDTNVFGLMRVTRAAIKTMRPQKAGTIIQISSMGGKITFPLYSIYHATKFAVEGFTESLQYELSLFNIRLRLVEPGPIVTDFYGRSRKFIAPPETSDYDGFIEKFNLADGKVLKNAEGPEVVARTIFQAATDSGNRMRYPVGRPGPLLLLVRKLVSDRIYFWMIRKAYRLD